MSPRPKLACRKIYIGLVFIRMLNALLLHVLTANIRSTRPKRWWVYYVPYRCHVDLSLDFINGLLPYWGYTTILVVVDRFSKGIYLGMLPNHHISHSVAILFMDIIGKLHSMPRSLVSNRDPLFLC